MTRLIMPFAEWPAIDQQRWHKARFKGDILEPSGLAANWTDNTVRQDKKAYGLWLQCLANAGRLAPDTAPGERLTRDNVNAFAADLAERVASTTTAKRLSTLSRMIRVLEPAADRSWLNELHKRYAFRAKPSRNKQIKMLHPADILEVIFRELEKERALLPQHGKRQLYWYRDLLIIGMLTVLPLRKANIQELDLDRSIIRISDRYEVRLEEHQTKNGSPYAAPLPEQFTPHIEIYLTQIRPILLRNKTSPALWLSFRGDRLSQQTIYLHTRSTTATLFGVELTPHLFRDIATTYLAVHHPEAVRSASAVLGHRSLKTTERHYNQANMLAAARQFQEAVG